MHRRNEVIVFLSVLVVHERFTSGFEDIFSREFTFTLEDTRRFKEIQGVAEVTSSEFGNEFK